MSPTEMAYRKTAIAGAGGFGLLIAVYDTLAGDLRRAAEAERANDLEKRAREVNHALLVVAYLEEWLSHGSGGQLAERLRVFYRTLRRRMIEAQAKRSPAILEEQMAEVLKIREIWQGMELRRDSAPHQVPAWVPPAGYPGASAGYARQGNSSWSA